MKWLLPVAALLLSGCARYDAYKAEKEYLSLKGTVYMTYAEHCERAKKVLGAWAIAGVEGKIAAWQSETNQRCFQASMAPGSGF